MDTSENTTDSARTSADELNEIDQPLPTYDPESLRGLIRDSLERRRRALVFGIAQKLVRCLEESGAKLQTGTAISSSDWVRIESLSQLRAVVGGRFQNLKQKWVNAGFPLREHRGDRGGEVAVDQASWVDLSLWISKQGYETRLASPNDAWLFEVRKI